MPPTPQSLAREAAPAAPTHAPEAPAGRLRTLVSRAAAGAGRPDADTLAALGAAAAEAERRLAAQQARIRYLESLSVTDELTGLLNRRGFEEELARTLARARRRRETGLLVLCDLDRFKAVNDGHGHPAGDAVLRAVAALLCRRTRRSDRVARTGGDEFAVLMPACDAAAARRRLARLAMQVNALEVAHAGASIAVAASFGSAAYGPETAAEALVFLADRALYRGKAPRLVAAADGPWPAEAGAR